MDRRQAGGARLRESAVSAQDILNRLDAARATGAGRWVARCPVHADQTPSLSVRELDDGKVLAHCFGCGANGEDVAVALGLHARDLFPQGIRDTETGPGGSPPLRQRWPPVRDLLRTAAHESLIVALAMESEWRGHDVPLEDWDRVLLAVQRLRGIADEQAGSS
jgi:hypothetical protein